MNAEPPGQGRPRPGPAPALVGRALAPIYGLAVRARNRRFDAGRGVRRLPLPVISVGNLSVGGTGKTPMVAWIVQRLATAGVPPAIAMRGYSPDGRHGPDSDEALQYRTLAPGVPIAADPDRYAAVTRLLAEPAGAAVRCVVLDDGFQHRALARDLDIVLIDATRDPFADRLLPAGWLREPVESLRRAGAVVITHAECAQPGAVDRIDQCLQRLMDRPADAVVRHAWAGLRLSDPPYDDDHPQPVSWLAGRRALALCGIGNPGPFIAMSRAACGSCDVQVFPDHETYAPSTVAGAFVRSEAFFRGAAAHEPVLTTEKDWTKLRTVARGLWSRPVARPVLELRFDRGERALTDRVLAAAGAPPAAP
ncbi:MAG: tetraacyldisaccharide 4'-kinase [Phycisphaerae bacterium]|nr:tetraacyldisaccharide 4'-kinase [Phycisphaerae bacterium]